MGMRILMGVVPSVITVLAFVIYVGGYKLDGSVLEKIASQLQAKRAAETVQGGITTHFPKRIPLHKQKTFPESICFPGAFSFQRPGPFPGALFSFIGRVGSGGSGCP